jgi:hypothetical protein
VPEKIDIVDVFRKAGDALPVVKEAVTLAPKAIWLQLGIVNDEAARIAKERGSTFSWTCASNRSTQGSSEKGESKTPRGHPGKTHGNRRPDSGGPVKDPRGKTVVKRTLSQHTPSHEEEADLVLKGGTILNVYSGELLEGNIAVSGERIVYVGPSEHHVGKHTTVLELTGRTIAPGYIEPHFHPWDVYNPVSVGEEACRRGTTTVFCDDLVFYMEMGPRLFQEFMDAFSDMPIKYY